MKKPKGGELLELEKAYNCRLARERVAIEHVNRTIKTFRILKD
ncbi:MAG: transposase family protein [Planctomycetaceae bacterium]|nr:transposase family protein [Planctomycetaceae bacterium]